jgi:heat shock protein HslJ
MEIKMKKTNLFLMALFVLPVLVLVACSGGASVSIVGDWVLSSYGEASNLTDAAPNVETSINFDEKGQFGGNVGCNSFGAEYKVDGDQIVFGSIISTMMFCDETSAQESAVLGILSDKTVKYQVDGDQLKITSSDGASAIVLVRK